MATCRENWVLCFLTDFGPSTAYVGVMKGVALKNFPQCRIVDLCHVIPPQDVVNGAWELMNSYKYFPSTTVFVCVVDPGVGGSRDALAIAFPGGPVFIGPDNGLLYPSVLREIEQGKVQPDVFVLSTKNAASSTFHGRDVFAPIGALTCASCGVVPCSCVERTISFADIVVREIPMVCQPSADGFISEGIVVSIDSYGNIITSAPPPPRVYTAEERMSLRITFTLGSKSKMEIKWYRTYAECPETSSFFLIIGSSNTFEISVKNGNAFKQLVAVGFNDLKVGAPVSIRVH